MWRPTFRWPWLRLEQQLAALRTQVTAMEGRIMSVLTDLQAAVAAEDTVVDSAVVLLKGLKDRLDAAGTDPAALAALSADIAAKTQTLADAVTANTPAA